MKKIEKLKNKIKMAERGSGKITLGLEEAKALLDELERQQPKPQQSVVIEKPKPTKIDLDGGKFK